MEPSNSFRVDVRNIFKKMELDINVRHHSTNVEKKIRPDSDPQPFYLEVGRVDHLDIWVDQASGELPACKVELPKNADFKFIPSGVTEVSISRIGDNIIFRIPGGPSGWKIKVITPSIPEYPHDNVSVGEDE